MKQRLKITSLALSICFGGISTAYSDLVENLNSATGTGGTSIAAANMGPSWDDGISHIRSFNGSGGGTTITSGSAGAILDGGLTGSSGDHGAQLTLNPTFSGGGYWFGGLIFQDLAGATSIDPTVMSLTADILAPSSGEFSLRVEQPDGAGSFVEFLGAGNGSYQPIGGLLSTGTLSGPDYNWLSSSVNLVISFRNGQGGTWLDGSDNTLTVDNLNFSATAVPEVSAAVSIPFALVVFGFGTIISRRNQRQTTSVGE